MSHLPGNREDDPTGAALASRFDQGLSLRSTMGGLDGTTSAPPPPGFGAAPDQRDGAYRLDLARGMLFQGGNGGADGDGIGSGAICVGGDAADITASGTSSGVRLQGFSDRGQQGAAPIGTRISEDNGSGLRQQGSSGALLRPSELAAYAGDIGRSFSAPPEDIDGQGMRSTSFANLAAALGEDLAESMNDSLQKQQSLNSLGGNGGGQHGQHQQQQHLPR